jgi:hypothetical protein
MKAILQRVAYIGDDKYLHTTEDSIMDTIDDQDNTQSDDKLDAQRDIIRQSLNEIANDVGMMLRDVALTFPVYITVGRSGNSLATIATPLDPSDDDWERASAIVRQMIGGGKLRSRKLVCAVANSRPMSAAEMTMG